MERAGLEPATSGLQKLYTAFRVELVQAGICRESRRFVRGLAGIAGSPSHRRRVRDTWG